MHENDIVEVTSDHPELTPVLGRGTQGVIVDLPPDSSLAAVEITLAPDDVGVFLLNLDDLRLVSAHSPQNFDTSLD